CRCRTRTPPRGPVHGARRSSSWPAPTTASPDTRRRWRMRSWPGCAGPTSVRRCTTAGYSLDAMARARACFEVEHLHQPDGWLSPGYLQADEHGTIVDVAAARPLDWPHDAVRIEGYAIPGMPNLHSHGFQRALAGRTEYRSHTTDTFWTWREAMYRCAEAIDPESLEDVT